MSFRENILKKIEIDGLAGKIISSLKPAGDIQKIDRQSVRQLLAFGDFRCIKQRDLELFLTDESRDPPEILVLDNGLALYRTAIEDVVMRKSPTVKEMVSIRNIIKILKDDDVVISRKTETVLKLKARCLDRLDLSFSEEDLDAIRLDGAASLESRYLEGVEEVLDIFAELLGYGPPPQPFRAAHHKIAGVRSSQASGKIIFGPLFIFSKAFVILKLIDQSLDTTQKEAVGYFQDIIDGKTKASLEGKAVFEYLMQNALKQHSGKVLF